MLEERLNEWMQKVLKAHNNNDPYVCVDNYKMIVDVDKIIAEEFNHDPVFAINL